MANNAQNIRSLDFGQRYFKHLSPQVADVLSLLQGEERIAFKGGIAKLCLMAAMIEHENLKDMKRWRLEQRINDIDLVFIFPSGQDDLKEMILEKFERTKNILLSRNIYLDPRDVDIIEDVNLEKALARILGSDDLTINEVALIFVAGKWRLFYSDLALDHTVRGIGMIAKPKTTNIHYDAGRIYFSPLGVVRLIKFLASCKVQKICLPKWRLGLLFDNYQKKVKAGQMPQNAPLGFYSLVLMKNYFGNDELAQKKAMVVLYDLGLTDMLDPELYVRQQEAIFADAHKEFALKEFTMEEIVDKYIENRSKREAAAKERQATRANCAHEFEAVPCELCGQNKCEIRYCQKCGKNQNAQPLPCTLRMWQGVCDPKDFYSLK
ncbi:MAG: hypothetical protein MUD10_02535 [Candidatus Pacebacteria bacterium]|nr:hypothetical protein [Candidatus Paceibacterota bacterium]